MLHISGIGAYFGAQCEKHGMLVRVSGDNIMMSPPCIITAKEIDEVGSRTFVDLIRLFIRRVRLMCALRAHINKSSFRKVLLGIEKVVKTFPISDKFFPKLVYQINTCCTAHINST